ncbi:hypothetical protein PV326_008397 [Microctonus aethiopoides]|uniref:Uncharacterized protein n=1 Tax=Microctonus aethiopoides TaxID=144406 RepID=A0AA39CAT9_9HYME|nr:hypothetical protein PV326_008397 [Microctonus aethiopoides]KAK0160797.1 hypothetical protein PV328_008165 [Microctonus aethiopoides]
MTNKTSNGKVTTDKLSDQGGIFDVVVRPMFQQGHEGELCSWLKESCLIRTSLGCPQPNCENKTLAWSAARIVDKYNWSCPNCHKRQSIREGSFFFGLKGDLKNCLQIILAWCQNIPIEIVASCLEVKEHVVKKVYERCGQVTESYVKTHPEDFQIGGPGVVLIVDEYPGGLMATESTTDVLITKKRNNNFHSILCIAEASLVPPRMWLHMMKSMPEPLPKNDNNNCEQKCGMVEEAMKEISQQVLPGSDLIANNCARCCNYESLQDLKQYRVYSVEQLQKLDKSYGNNLMSNLATIWQIGVAICEEIQESPHSVGQQIISSYLWRQRFGSVPSTAFQYMLNHIAECYRFN